MDGKDLMLVYTVSVYFNLMYFLSSCMHFPTSSLNLMGKTVMYCCDKLIYSKYMEFVGCYMYLFQL